MKKKTPMTKEAAIRIQKAAARKNEGKVEKGSFAAKAQSVADQVEIRDSKSKSRHA